MIEIIILWLALFIGTEIYLMQVFNTSILLELLNKKNSKKDKFIILVSIILPLITLGLILIESEGDDE